MDNYTINRLLSGVGRFSPETETIERCRRAFEEMESMAEVVGFLFAAIDAISHGQLEKTLAEKGCAS